MLLTAVTVDVSKLYFLIIALSTLVSERVLPGLMARQLGPENGFRAVDVFSQSH